jgi:hypothetical protein
MSYNYDPDNGTDYSTSFVFYSELFFDTIDAADYDYVIDSYDPETKGPDYLTEYDVYDSGLSILTSVDAAAASLRLGTESEDTQLIEIGSTDVTTTIYGPVAMLKEINASSMSLAYAFNVSGKTTLENVSCKALTATSFNCDTYDATGGTMTIGITGSATVAMGSTGNTLTTINGGQIKQIIPLPGGVTRNMEIINGQNGENTPSLANTFNRKYTTDLTALPCYRIGAPSSATTQYFEIVVSGSNTGSDGYCYKGLFAMSKPAGVMTPSSVSTLFSYGGTTTISFVNIDAFTIDLYVLTSGGIEQNFITTLTAYPTASPVFPGGLYYDYTSVAV